MTHLSTADIDELDALAETWQATGRPTPLLRRHWHESNYRSLVRQGLVHWGAPPEGFSPRRWAGARITIFGRLTLAAALRARETIAKARGSSPKGDA